jgi:hypothetical protein
MKKRICEMCVYYLSFRMCQPQKRQTYFRECRIRSSEGDDYEDFYLLEYNAV